MSDKGLTMRVASSWLVGLSLTFCRIGVWVGAEEGQDCFGLTAQLQSLSE